MPNWSYNNFAIVGKKKNILNFVNEGLKNSGLEPMEDLALAVKKLQSEGITKEGGKWNGKEGEVVVVKRITMGTFLPLIESVYKYDTTNAKEKRDAINWHGGKKDKPMFNSDEEYDAYSKAYDEAVKEQHKVYGCHGWYDIDCIVYGTKWNAELEGFTLDFEDEETARLSFSNSTAWNWPEAWCTWIKETFDVHVLVCCSEESNEYNFFGDVGEETVIDYGDFSECEGYPQEEDFEDTDEYYEARSDFDEECKEKLWSEFSDFVENFEI